MFIFVTNLFNLIIDKSFKGLKLTLVFLPATVSQRQRDTLMWTNPVHLHLNSVTCFLELGMTFFQTEVCFSMDNFYERFLQVLTYDYHFLKWINLIPNTWSFHPLSFFESLPN